MESASRPNEALSDSRYFCHSCDAEIGTVTDVCWINKIIIIFDLYPLTYIFFKEYTCPTCNLGFIEKVEEQQTPEEPDDEDMEFPNAHHYMVFQFFIFIMNFKKCTSMFIKFDHALLTKFTTLLRFILRAGLRFLPPMGWIKFTT